MTPRRSDGRKLVVGLSGASGLVYGLRLLDNIRFARVLYGRVFVVYTDNAAKIARLEEGVDLVSHLRGLEGVDGIYHSNDLSSPLASSSNLVSTDMVIAPASMSTIARIAQGVQDNLLTRVAAGVLRLGNKLVVVPRETPLSTIDLRNLYLLSEAGAVVLPAMPAFYIKPKSVEDLVLFIVGKVFDALGVEHSLYPKWGEASWSP
ncbi:MAG: UbiX family flavin prenyltransferase [Thermogladius sp.]|jgi:4-hydroxy-3-polyprenylbenzoate decarboxylase|nr:UbiX family flavin prenyltransferase [Thermogladius sp.]